ncbi:MAG: hypothetical protein JW749_03075 [Sedimentisphaerales bacterium]|nr:hypothetical protein [Sedimentisphaerales bacterium]
MKTQCPNCKAQFKANDANAGKQAKCPKCGKPFIIEPLIEKPVEKPAATAPPAQSSKPAEAPVKHSQPKIPPLMIRPPLAEPTSVRAPAKSAEPAAPPVERPKPAEPPEKIQEPVEEPVTERAEPAAPPVERPEPEEEPVKSEAPAAAAVTSPEETVPPVTIPEPAARPAPVAAPVKSAAPIKEEKAESKQAPTKVISKALFVYFWMFVRMIAGALGAAGLMLAVGKDIGLPLDIIPGIKLEAFMFFAGADVFLIFSVLIELMLFYRMWAAIKDSQTSITPGRAVGFLFIPVFNIYWALCMVIGFAEDYNSFIRRRGITAKSLPMAIYVIYAFAFMLSILFVTTPMLSVFGFVDRISAAFASYTSISWGLFGFIGGVGIAHFITYMLFAIKTCNAINALPARK